ncbi:hypothetical protein H0H93_012229 [Arthromyces matolae]|nr:hypothetical protein H0H93_012229 [Arthromyces matolae]
MDMTLLRLKAQRQSLLVPYGFECNCTACCDPTYEERVASMETLSSRVERHLSNALALAKYLEAHPKVAWVSYLGRPSHEYHKTAKRLLKGFGCVLSFGVKGGRGDIIVDNLKLHTSLANIGRGKILVSDLPHLSLDDFFRWGQNE